jgi:hypothetical protein
MGYPVANGEWKKDSNRPGKGNRRVDVKLLRFPVSPDLGLNNKFEETLMQSSNPRRRTSRTVGKSPQSSKYLNERVQKPARDDPNKYRSPSRIGIVS